MNRSRDNALFSGDSERLGVDFSATRQERQVVGPVVGVAHPGSFAVDGENLEMREEVGTRAHTVAHRYDLIIISVVTYREHV
jgi:hypothetical protein